VPARAWRAAALAVCVCACVALSACGGGSSTPQLPPLHPGLIGPSTTFTPSNGELFADPVGQLTELRNVGVDTIHLYLHWSDIAPDPQSRTKPSFDATDPNAYPAAAWASFDETVRETRALGMAIDLDLVPPPPLWASGPGAPHPAEHPYWKPNPVEFGQFVRAVGTRYSGHYVPPGASAPLPRVTNWSIWNEPNLGIELAPEAIPHTHIEVSGYLYRGLLNAAWSGLEATGHSHDQIVIGEIAPAGATFGGAPGNFAAMPPLRFLRALYCVGQSYQPLRGLAARQRHCPTTAAGTAVFAKQNPALFQASGFADHPYTQALPPNEAVPHEPDYAVLADVPHLEHVLDVLQRVYGSHRQFPIYSTEFGFQTNPPESTGLTVSPQTAAYYMNWSEYLTWLNPRLRTFDQYLLQDGGSIFASGLKFPSGAPKPSYAAFRMPLFLPVTETSKGQPLDVWGGVRPAHLAQEQTRRTQQVKIQFASGPKGGFSTVQTVPITDRYGYFEVRHRFSGSGRVRLAWSYPKGPEVFSRTVVITLR
jgi:hypothetical protein